MEKTNHGQAPMEKTANGSQEIQRTPEVTRRKRKCAGIYPIRMVLGVIMIVVVIVITQVQYEGWQAISNALFGGITLSSAIRQIAIVVLSMIVGYWMKKPRKVYFKGKTNTQQEKTSNAGGQKAEEK